MLPAMRWSKTPSGIWIHWEAATRCGFPSIPKSLPGTPKSSYSGAHEMWQYTSKGQVAGIRGNVDVNVAYFGYSQEAEAKDKNPAQIVEANPEVGMRFTEVDETVTAKDATNLRNLPTTEGSTVVYQLKNGETVQRTGVGSNGWDRVIYNGQRLYAVHSFLTTDLDAQKPAEPKQPSDSPAVRWHRGKRDRRHGAGCSVRRADEPGRRTDLSGGQ